VSTYDKKKLIHVKNGEIAYFQKSVRNKILDKYFYSQGPKNHYFKYFQGYIGIFAHNNKNRWRIFVEKQEIQQKIPYLK
jgi:hypothetical protein